VQHYKWILSYICLYIEYYITITIMNRFKMTKMDDVQRNHTKIGNLDIKVFVEKQIFWLQISVHNHVPMTVVNSGNNLLEKPPCSRFLQLPLDTLFKLLYWLRVKWILLKNSTNTKILQSNIDGNLQQKSFACLFLLITCNWKHWATTAVGSLLANIFSKTYNKPLYIIKIIKLTFNTNL